MKNLVIYFVFGEDFKSNLENLQTILSILVKYNLKMNTGKCKSLHQELDILGQSVSTKGIESLKQNIEPILNIQ